MHSKSPRGRSRTATAEATGLQPASLANGMPTEVRELAAPSYSWMSIGCQGTGADMALQGRERDRLPVCSAGTRGIEPLRRWFWRPPGYLSLIPMFSCLALQRERVPSGPPDLVVLSLGGLWPTAGGLPAEDWLALGRIAGPNRARRCIRFCAPRGSQMAPQLLGGGEIHHRFSDYPSIRLCQRLLYPGLSGRRDLEDEDSVR